MIGLKIIAMQTTNTIMICIETNKNITAEVDLLDLVIKLVHTSDDINKKKVLVVVLIVVQKLVECIIQ
jgi:hypothetical protein